MKPILYKAKAVNRDDDVDYRTSYKNGDWVRGIVSYTYKGEYADRYGVAMPFEMTNEVGVSRIEVDKDTICEYTCMTDYEGKPIFESDILADRYSDDRYVVEWNYDAAGWSIRKLNAGTDAAVTLFSQINTKNFIIVGNKHDCKTT